MNSKSRIISSRAGATPLCDRDRRVLQRVAQRANDNRAANNASEQPATAVLNAMRGLGLAIVGVPALVAAWIRLSLLPLRQAVFLAAGRGGIGRLVPRHDGNMVRQQSSEAGIGDAPVRATLRAV